MSDICISLWGHEFNGSKILKFLEMGMGQGAKGK